MDATLYHRRIGAGAFSRSFRRGILSAALLPTPVHALSGVPRDLPSGTMVLIWLLALATIGIAFVCGWVFICKLRPADRCPHCSVTGVRRSHPRKWRDYVFLKLGLVSIRCSTCGRRSHIRSPEMGLQTSPKRVPGKRAELATFLTAPPQVHTRVSVPYQRSPVAQIVVKQRRRRKDRSKVAVATSAAAVGAATLIVAAVIGYRLSARNSAAAQTSARRDGSTVTAANTGADHIAAQEVHTEFNLVVPEAGIVERGGIRRIKGVLQNNGRVAYKNVEIVFAAQDGGLQSQIVTASVARVEPGGVVAFETGPLPKGTVRFDLRPVNAR